MTCELKNREERQKTFTRAVNFILEWAIFIQTLAQTWREQRNLLNVWLKNRLISYSKTEL